MKKIGCAAGRQQPDGGQPVHSEHERGEPRRDPTPGQRRGPQTGRHTSGLGDTHHRYRQRQQDKEFSEEFFV